MLYVLALLLLALTPITASAQSSAAPSFTVGDEWKTSLGFVRTVVKVEPDMTAMRGIAGCPTCLLYVDKGLNWAKVENADGSAADSAAIGFVPVGAEWTLYQFPLEVGKKWNFGAKGLFRNSVNHYDFVCKVEAYEDVTIKIGTFKAFKITRDATIRSIDNRRGFSWSSSEWFAPEIKFSVKFTTTNPNQKDWELASFTVK